MSAQAMSTSPSEAEPRSRGLPSAVMCQLISPRVLKCDWPYFQTVLSNMDMVLAKSNIAIASRYAGLVADAR